MADRDLARLAAFLLEVQHPLITGVIKTAAAKRGHGAGARGGVDQDGDDGAIAEATDTEGEIAQKLVAKRTRFGLVSAKGKWSVFQGG